LPAYLIGVGVQAEHVRSPKGREEARATQPGGLVRNP
jgi:hypothetical protein